MSNPNDYTIGWICAIKTEYVAAQQFLDEVHQDPESVAPRDDNVYTLGRIGRHNVVMACLPRAEYGLTSAATVARDMLHSFPNVRVGLMVGIAGGAPSAKHDVRLGDVVVSSRADGRSGVFQYDYGKAIQGQEFQTTQSLNQPPKLVLSALSKLEARHEVDGHGLDTRVEEVLQKKSRLRKGYSRPPASSDRLYKSDVVHRATEDGKCSDEDACGTDPAQMVTRPARGEDEDDPAIHYGLIASANQLMKDALTRDKMAKEGVLCFEMEAAGLMNHFPCLVVRGICDYADSHKNKEWQGYAAMVAAAYARDVLLTIAPAKVQEEKRIAEALDNIGLQVSALKSDHDTRKMERWLHPPDPSTNANLARRVRHEGTGAWLLCHPVFEAWKSGARRHVWLHGMMGCGKTVLSATVLDHVQQVDEDRIIISFFFDFSDTRKQTVDGMLRSLAFQLYRRQPKPHDSSTLDASFLAHDKGSRQPNLEALKDVVKKMLTGQNVSIVLDALDESSTRGELLSWLSDITADAPGLEAVQLICTSRPEHDFLEEISDMIGDDGCIQLDNQVIDDDIGLYVAAQLSQRKAFQEKRLPRDLAEQIRSQIRRGAGGMFRWAACQLDALERCRSPKEIMAALASLPRDLNGTYERILDSIPDADKPGTRRLLQFLAHSGKPLSVQKAVEIIATDIDVEPPCFDITGRLLVEEEVRQYGLGLLSFFTVSAEEFDDIDRYYPEPGPGDVETITEVRLAHFSVREFLVRRPDFDRSHSGIAITKICVMYLHDVAGIVKTADAMGSTLKNFPFTRSAARLWKTFGRAAEKNEDTFRAMMRFWDNKEAFGFLWRVQHGSLQKGLSLTDELYEASLMGLLRVVQELIGRGADVREPAFFGHTALHAASAGGYYEIAKLLLENGADVTARPSESPALQAATHWGRDNIVELLLDNGADVNTETNGPPEISQTVLLEALQYGRGTTAKILYERGADVHSRTNSSKGALHRASMSGLVDWVELLLAKGADVNASDDLHGTALGAASSNGYMEIVEMLLAKGADVNKQGGKYGNPLQAASVWGDLDIIALLIRKGANVNALGGFYGDALTAAVAVGYLDAANLLLDSGAEFHTSAGGHGNALQAAVVHGLIEAVELLLERGADVNVEGGEYHTALQAAAAEGYLKIVTLLLERGADMKAEGGRYHTALQAATAKGRTKVIQLLLERGADVTSGRRV